MKELTKDIQMKKKECNKWRLKNNKGKREKVRNKIINKRKMKDLEKEKRKKLKQRSSTLKIVTHNGYSEICQ